ncbi:MAG TPA: hypothetical protein VGL27_02895 [Negativicutes bacterium]
MIQVARQVSGVDFQAKEAPRRPRNPAILIAGAEKVGQSLSWIPPL